MIHFSLSGSRLRLKKPRGEAPGFTLLEVLVATTILLVVVVMLGTMTGHISKMWTEVNGQTQRRTIGRELLQFIARDLQAARLQLPTNPAAVTSGSGNLQFMVVSGTDAIASGIANPQAIFWQAPIATNSTQGNIAEIGYFVQWDTTTTPGKAKASLCRYYSDATKPSFGIYTSGTSALGGLWLGGSGVPLIVAPGTPGSKYTGWLADNVIALWIRCTTGGAGIISGSSNQTVRLYKNQGGATQPPVNNGYTFNSQLGYVDPLTNLGHPGPTLPPCVEISLVVVDSNTAQKITAPLTAFVKAPALPTTLTPVNYASGTSTAGSIQSYVNALPPYIKSGAEIYSTSVFFQNVTN